MRRKLNILLTSTVVLVISYYSLRPQALGNGPGGGNTQFLHFLAYTVLAVSFLPYLHDRSRGYYISFLLAFIFGFSIELIQTQVPTRFFSLEDIAVNLLGSSLILLDVRSRYFEELLQLEGRILSEVEEFLP